MKEGDRVKVFLDKEIKKAKSKKKKHQICSGVLKLWEAINGHLGTITKIVNDDEVWVVGDRTKRERIFSKETLKVANEI